MGAQWDIFPPEEGGGVEENEAEKWEIIVANGDKSALAVSDRPEGSG